MGDGGGDLGGVRSRFEGDGFGRFCFGAAGLRSMVVRFGFGFEGRSAAVESVELRWAPSRALRRNGTAAAFDRAIGVDVCICVGLRNV